MKAKKIAVWGIMGALALVLTAFEGLLAIPFLPVGAKPGFSNIITVAAAMTFGTGGAIYISVLKALFAFFTRGGAAFLLSALGGISSAFVTAALLKIKRSPFSLVGISIIGALIHNSGQLLGAFILTKTSSIFYYAIVLALFGLVCGFLTGVILNAVKPYLNKINFKEKN